MISGIRVGQHEAHVWRQDAVQSVCIQPTSAHPLPPLQHHQEQQAQHVGLRVVFFPFRYAAYKYLKKNKRIPFFSCLCSVISSLSNRDDDDGVETSLKKWICVVCNFYWIYLDPLYFSNVGVFSWSWIIRTYSRFKNRKENSSLSVHVLHKMRFVVSSVSFDCIYFLTTVEPPLSGQ